MRFIIPTLFLVFAWSSGAFASSSVEDAYKYKCSDGHDYGVILLTFGMGGGPDANQVRSFCEWETVQQFKTIMMDFDRSNGLDAQLREACNQSVAPAVHSCFLEYQKLNEIGERDPNYGRFVTFPIIHGRSGE